MTFHPAKEGKKKNMEQLNYFYKISTSRYNKNDFLRLILQDQT